MKNLNLWSVTKNPFATWRANLMGARHDSQALLSWLLAVVEASEENGIFTVLNAPRIAYRRDRDGSLVAFLKRQFDETGKVDLFYFALRWFQRVNGELFQSCTRLNYFEGDGNIAMAEVVGDLSVFLKQLRPDYTTGSNLCCRPGLPMKIWGPEGPYDHPQFQGVHVQFILHTDIWLPWIHHASEIREHANVSQRMVPICRNPLAQHHTPRLNRFLAAVRDETVRVGGTWQLDRDFSSELFMLDDNGIPLDAELPANYVEV
jgi:hypothetical protein